MKKLLITGASGYLGWHCSQQLPHDWQGIGTFHKHKTGIHASTAAYQVDLTDKDAVWKMMKEIKPAAVFHLAAVSSTGQCEKAPEETYPINVEAPTHLAEMAADLKAKLLFTSSEQVFDGEKGDYAETDQPNPKNKYGEQKLEAEKNIQKIYPEAVIVRIAVLFGQATPVSQSFLNQWIDTWKKMLTVTAFHDEIRPFMSSTSCASALFHLVQQGAEGLFHLGGSTAYSRYDFAQLSKEVLELPFGKIASKSQQEVEMPAFRPANLSLVCGKIEGTGFTLSNAIDELKRIRPFLQTQPSVSLN